MKSMVVFLPAVLSLWLLLTGLPLSAAPDRGDLEYDLRAAGLNRLEANELTDLADWCRQKGLHEQAHQLLRRALTINPQHEGANKVLEQLRGLTWQPKLCNVEVFLADGTRLRGEALLHEITLRLDYGMLRFPVRKLDLVAFDFIDGSDLVMADGLSLVGRVGLGTFETTTKAGKITVGGHNLIRLHIIRVCEVCGGRLKVTCSKCHGKGSVEIRKVCPTCNGVDSVTRCQNCRGRGTIRCSRCRGRGSLRLGWGRRRTCPRCKGKGRIGCPDCEGTGQIRCLACKGTGSLSETVVCPLCNGVKTRPCGACKGIGERRVPEPVWPIHPTSRTDELQ